MLPINFGRSVSTMYVAYSMSDGFSLSRGSGWQIINTSYLLILSFLSYVYGLNELGILRSAPFLGVEFVFVFLTYFEHWIPDYNKKFRDPSVAA